MASQAQIDANRRNARKRTGPKSTAGKSVARLNAVKHGLTAARVILADEDAEEFEALRDELERELEPVGRLEIDLVETIALGMWRKRRIPCMEADIMAYEQAEKELSLAERELKKYEYDDPSPWTAELDPFGKLEEEDGKPEADEDNEDDREYLAAKAKVDRAREKLTGLEATLGTFLLGHPKYTNALEKLMRYEAALDRSLARARDQLARLRRERQDKAAAHATVVDADHELRETSG